jgi:hypothetical protein
MSRHSSSSHQPRLGAAVKLCRLRGISLFGALGVPLHDCAHDKIQTVLQSIGATAANERTGPEIRQASSIARL